MLFTSACIRSRVVSALSLFGTESFRRDFTFDTWREWRRHWRRKWYTWGSQKPSNKVIKTWERKKLFSHKINRYVIFRMTLLSYEYIVRSFLFLLWWMDGWVRVLRPFNSISVISRRWKGEHERLCAMKRRLGSGRISPQAGFEPATPWSEVGSANRSATRTLLFIVKCTRFDIP